MVANNERRGIKVEYTVPEIIRREARARQRLAFEEKLLKGSFKSEVETQAFVDSQGIDDTTGEYSLRHDRFTKQVEDTEAAEISIHELLFEEWEQDNTEFPEEWGERFFEHWVGTLPSDVVVFRRRPNYFQIVCESGEDHENLMAALYPTKDNADVRGTMHNNRSTNLAGVVGRINLMIIKGKENSKTTRGIIAHEEQHAMNYLELDSFTALEAAAFKGKKLYIDPEQRKTAIVQFVTLKDELLANFRQRKDASNIYDDLAAYELFNNLENLSGQLFDATLSLFSRIIDEFAELQPLLSTEEDYGLLVYQLTDLPLLDFPKYLRAYCTYLEHDTERFSAAAK